MTFDPKAARERCEKHVKLAADAKAAIPGPLDAAGLERWSVIEWERIRLRDQCAADLPAALDEIERLTELLRVADVTLKLDDTLEKANEDEIAALRSRVVEMEGALQDLATATDNATYDGRTHTCVGGGLPCSGCERGERARLRAIESVKSARAALRKPEGG